MWATWALTSVLATALFGGLMWSPDEMASLPIDRTVFLPGTTTDGHYQIELDCAACHTERFSDPVSIQEACVGCHGAELERVDDSHPRRKFTDPRNADRVAVLDARLCVTCHQEHRPEITSTMGLSLQGDYCYRCHETIAEDRPTHEALAFDSCASSGCHNFHDNRSLYEDFLVEHADEPDHLPVRRVAPRPPGSLSERAGLAPRDPLTARDADGPDTRVRDETHVEAWASSGHALAGVNCSDCHTDPSRGWRDAVPLTVCADCHHDEHEGFLASRHGMRLASGLDPMRPRDARRPMHETAADRVLDCHACHSAHGYDTTHAAAEACLECHADDHSLAWRDSPHARAWQDERSTSETTGSGVSCATCHLPRVRDREGSVRVSHNQNDHLRPGDKMIRVVCMECHGLGFSLDSLADPALVATNFRGRSTRKVESIHFATKLRWQLEGTPMPGALTGSEDEGKMR